MTLRESGYYWVKVFSDSNWTIAEYIAPLNCWYMAGYTLEITEQELAEVDEERLQRSPQCIT